MIGAIAVAAGEVASAFVPLGTGAVSAKPWQAARIGCERLGSDSERTASDLISE